MEHDHCDGRTARFAAFVGDLASVVGTRRAAPLTRCCTGLLLPSERKSGEPMAAQTAPSRTAAQHQSMLHVVGKADWSDAAVLKQVRTHILTRI